MDPEHLRPSFDNLSAVSVFPLIPSIRKRVSDTVDSALTWEQLTAADINFSIVRPIVNRYARLKNMAVVYACLVVRSYFCAQAESDLAFAGVMLARASLCEILAIKLLARFATNYIQLVAVLTTAWNPLTGAPPQVMNEIKLNLNARDDDIDSSESAIEIAISSQAKHFLACPVAQRVVNDIYSGRVVFSATANRSIMADNYKSRAIEIYNPLDTPFLDHYRLRVPKYGAYLEFINFSLLLFTFILCLANRDKEKLNPWEIVFILFGSAFALEEYTHSTEHGWIIYIANLWNGFDFAFIVIFIAYLTLRIRGLSSDNIEASDMAFDVLACGACILFPRLAFFAVSNNVVVLALRAMISQFVFFIGIASICFSGLLFTLWTLARDNPVQHNPWTFKSISWLMVQIWFGNTYLSFAQATSFHPLFGPILMTIFAALSNTLLLTILISILSNTFATIDANATNEYLFQFTITTIQGVKSDALFSYQPPFNILAFSILKPASWFLSPRALHSLNVFLIKVTNMPQLFVIGIYERYLMSGQRFRETGKDAAQSLFNSLPRHIKNMPLVEALVGSSSNDLYDAIFDLTLDDQPDIVEDSDGEEVPRLRSMHSRENVRARSLPRSPTPRIQTHRPTSLGRASAASRSPRQRPMDSNSLAPLELMPSPEVVVTQSPTRSPLARLFGSRFVSSPVTLQASPVYDSAAAAQVAQATLNTETSVKNIESLLEAVSDLPVQKLKEEMKELQDRQARIENLLLMLTRGMRNETTGRQGSTL